MVVKLDKIEAALGPYSKLVQRFDGNCRVMADFVNSELPGLNVSERAMRHYRDDYYRYRSPEDRIIGEAIRGSDKWLFNEMLRDIREIRSGLTIPPFTRKPTPDKEDLALVISDLHFGKIYEQGGRQVFNINIAKRNFARLIENARHLTETYIRPQHKLDELILFFVGDIVDGEIVYTTQVYNIEFPVRKQIKMALQTIMPLLKWGSETFEAVRVFTTFGNHGVDDRMHMTSNWDMLLYDFMEVSSQDLDNVSFKISEDSYNLAPVRGHKYLLRHKIPSQLQTAIGRSKIGGWWNIHQFSALLTGHWHHTKLENWNGIPIFYNGNLFLTDDYTEELSFHGKPSQWLFGISDKRPTTLLWPVQLE